jgi:hypothetical protein
LHLHPWAAPGTEFFLFTTSPHYAPLEEQEPSMAGETSGPGTRWQAVLPGRAAGLRRDQPRHHWRTTGKRSVLAATRYGRPITRARLQNYLQVHMTRMGAPAKLYKSLALPSQGRCDRSAGCWGRPCLRSS